MHTAQRRRTGGRAHSCNCLAWLRLADDTGTGEMDLHPQRHVPLSVQLGDGYRRIDTHHWGVLIAGGTALLLDSETA